MCTAHHKLHFCALVPHHKAHLFVKGRSTGPCFTQELPSTIADLGTAVKTLDATNNRLAEFPVSFCFALSSLHRLVLSNNKLAALPEELGKLVQLKVRQPPR